MSRKLNRTKINAIDREIRALQMEEEGMITNRKEEMPRGRQIRLREIEHRIQSLERHRNEMINRANSNQNFNNMSENNQIQYALKMSMMNQNAPTARIRQAARPAVSSPRNTRKRPAIAPKPTVMTKPTIAPKFKSGTSACSNKPLTRYQQRLLETKKTTK